MPRRRTRPPAARPAARPAAGPVRIKIKHRGDLMGYATRSPTAERRAALRAAIAAWGTTHVVRKLNALSILTKNRAPESSRTFRTDMKWVQRVRDAARKKTSRSVGLPVSW